MHWNEREKGGGVEHCLEKGKEWVKDQFKFKGEKPSFLALGRVMLVIPALGTPNQVDCKSEVSLRYIVRSCLGIKRFLYPQKRKKR